MIKDWKKIGKDIWENKYKAIAVKITIIGNSKFGKIDDYAVQIIHWFGTDEEHMYTYTTFKTKSQAMSYARKFMRSN